MYFDLLYLLKDGSSIKGWGQGRCAGGYIC